MGKVAIIEDGKIVCILADYKTELLDNMIGIEDGDIGDAIIDGKVISNIVISEINKIKQTFIPEISLLMDIEVKKKGYDSIISLISYKDDPNTKYASEALSGINYRSAVWAYCEDQLYKYENKEIEIPALQDFLLNAPKIQWPTT